MRQETFEPYHTHNPSRRPELPNGVAGFVLFVWAMAGAVLAGVVPCSLGTAVCRAGNGRRTAIGLRPGLCAGTLAAGRRRLGFSQGVVSLFMKGRGGGGLWQGWVAGGWPLSSRHPCCWSPLGPCWCDGFLVSGQWQCIESFQGGRLTLQAACVRKQACIFGRGEQGQGIYAFECAVQI